MHAAIRAQAFPGANLLVAKNGKTLFHKAYGYHTYDSLVRVGPNDVYDLASVTKITGPLPALMKLHGEGKLDLDAPFANYWKPWKKRKDKKELTVREVLAHQAGLTPYIIFLNEAMRKGELKKRWFSPTPKKGYVQVYAGLYIKNRFRNKVYRMVNRSRVSAEKKYKYSGLTFLLYPEIIENLTGTDYETYLQQEFYGPLGMETFGFNPKSKGIKAPIVPTEVDTLLRHDLTHDWVHDENAALLGGVSGNAGLFGSATDLAKLMQLYVQMGEFKGKRYIAESTLREFTRIQYPENDNRRGLGFDKPLVGNDTLSIAAAYPAPKTSPESFGHAGFTGTFVWADPKNQLVFIFLSNRVYPSRSHRELYNLNVRGALQQLFYE
jgi:CubicO group peptidase (beta-lactamase class C family)